MNAMMEIENAAPIDTPHSAQALLSWYAIRVRPQKDSVAKMLLEKRGFDVLVPTVMRLRRSNHRCRAKRPAPSLVMPGYVLVGFDGGYDALAVEELYKLYIVTGVVCVDGKRKTIPYTNIERLLESCRSESLMASRLRSTADHLAGVEPGDQVRVTSGPYDGHVVNLHEIKGKAARVLVMLFSRQFAVDVPLDSLERND